MSTKITAKRPLYLVCNSLLQISLLLFLLALTWLKLSKTDFLYPQLYQSLNIYEHIQTYAPKNLLKPNFEQTDKDQHLLLFSQILTAINEEATGLKQAFTLENIRYQDHHGINRALLTEAEVIHLKDVAHLLKQLFKAGALAIVGLVVTLYLIHRNGLACFGIRHTLLLWSLILAPILVAFLLLGPLKLFYHLHVLLFPAENQWFFYYEQSLMATLMKAPDVFGPMASLWFGATLVIFLLSYGSIVKIIGPSRGQRLAH